MTARLWSRVAITLAVTLIGLYGIFGLPTSLDEAKQNIAERIPLGLDLKGGTHLILQVQVQDAIRHWLGALDFPRGVRVSVDIDPYSFV